MTDTQTLIDKLRAARHVLVFTGAGVSAESGVPTFRGADGWWKTHRPESLATPDAFRRDPVLVQDWYRHRRKGLAACAPNPAHTAIAHLASLVPHLTLVTQNVDDLHERAGNSGVLHLHGRIRHSYCADCHAPADLDAGDALPIRCDACGGLVRPAVVWFGESLPGDVFREAEAAAQRADVVLCVGTSGIVYPAAALPLLAVECGAYGAEINPEKSALASAMDVWIGEAAGVALPRIVDLVEHTHA